MPGLGFILSPADSPVHVPAGLHEQGLLIAHQWGSDRLAGSLLRPDPLPFPGVFPKLGFDGRVPFPRVLCCDGSGPARQGKGIAACVLPGQWSAVPGLPCKTANLWQLGWGTMLWGPSCCCPLMVSGLSVAFFFRLSRGGLPRAHSRGQVKAEGENKAGAEVCTSRGGPTGPTATRLPMGLAMLSLLRRAGRRGLGWWVASLCPAKALLGGPGPWTLKFSPGDPHPCGAPWMPWRNRLSQPKLQPWVLRVLGGCC